MTTANHRTADFPIDPLFLERWSPRAFDGSAISYDQLMSLLEAARWAPSSYNAQPWRFLYALRDTPAWETFLGLLLPFNASWAQRASVLFVIVSDRMMAGSDGSLRPSHSHSFDAGAAWAQLALQATRMGLQAHGMTGFDIARAQTELHVPERYRVEAAIAVGRPGDKSVLPEVLQGREAPNGRNPVDSFASEGGWRD
ncbi:MAG: putative nitroreductase [Sphingomonas bacterium]|nr:putative nitroreductase [Sphingomonas bacterium]